MKIFFESQIRRNVNKQLISLIQPVNTWGDITENTEYTAKINYKTISL